MNQGMTCIGRLAAAVLLVAAVQSVQAQYLRSSEEDNIRIPLSGDPSIDLVHASYADVATAGPDSILKPKQSVPRKSPLQAALFSFIVPGTGEMYAQQPYKGAVFLAVEATLWIVYGVNQSRGDKRTEEFQAYADAHWSVVRYATWTDQNKALLNPSAGSFTPLSEIVVSNDESKKPWERVNFIKLNELESQISRVTQNGYTHLLPPHGEQQYFEMIGKYHQFIAGWDDNPNPPTSDVTSGKASPRFLEYSSMRGTANDSYYLASRIASVLVLNHVISALDAAWSAARYNAHIRVEADLVPVRHLDGYADLVPTAKVRVEF